MPGSRYLDPQLGKEKFQGSYYNQIYISLSISIALLHISPLPVSLLPISFLPIPVISLTLSYYLSPTYISLISPHSPPQSFFSLFLPSLWEKIYLYLFTHLSIPYLSLLFSNEAIEELEFCNGTSV
jgi:hypothetical protein